MGFQSIAEDFITACIDVIDEVGETLTVTYSTKGDIDPNNPGAGRTKTSGSMPVEGILTDYENDYIDGTLIKKGDRLAILSVGCLTVPIEQGMFVNDGTRSYKIEFLENPQVSGNTVVVCANIRG